MPYSRQSGGTAISTRAHLAIRYLSTPRLYPAFGLSARSQCWVTASSLAQQSHTPNELGETQGFIEHDTYELKQPLPLRPHRL